MTGGEVAQIILALATLITAAAAALVSVLTLRRAIVNSTKIEEIHLATNGMKDALVKVTGESEFAKGLKQGEEHPKT